MNPCKGCIVFGACECSFHKSSKKYIKCIQLFKQKKHGILVAIDPSPSRRTFSKFHILNRCVKNNSKLCITVAECGWKALVDPESERVVTLFIDLKILHTKIGHYFQGDGTYEVIMKKFPVIETRFPGESLYLM